MSHEESFAKAELARVDGAFMRIDESHPAGIYLGIEAGKRTVMVICETQPPDAPSLAAIHVEARLRQGGDWALVLRLEDKDLRLLFARLVEDLEDATRLQPARPGEVVVERLVRWQQLLARRRAGTLDDDKLRGLIAELCFLVDEAIPRTGVDSATLAWRGPFCAPKDYVWPSVQVEVKAIHAHQRDVTISSLEQLSDAGIPLYLWCKTVEIAAAAGTGVVSAADLVECARSLVRVNGPANDRFEESLLSAGYTDHGEYHERFLSLGAGIFFAVTTDFPRIQRHEVASGVVAATYDLRLAVLQPFIVTSWTG